MKQKSELDKCIQELRNYGYSDQEIMDLHHPFQHLQSVKQYCIMPNSEAWKKYEIDKKHGPLETHIKNGSRIHFCNCCGEPIRIGYPESENAG